MDEHDRRNIVHTSEEKRHRALCIVQNAEYRREHGLADAEMTPFEVIARAHLGEITRDEMIRDLRSREYTQSYIPEGGYDSSILGTEEDLVGAIATGLLSRDEFRMIFPDESPHTDE